MGIRIGSGKRGTKAIAGVSTVDLKQRLENSTGKERVKILNELQKRGH